MSWLISNLGTIIVSAILLGIIVAIVVIQVKHKKQGKSSCSCGCAGCAHAQACHGASEPEDKTE